MDSEPIDAGEAPEFAGLDPIDVTIVVDDQGRLVQGEEVFGAWFDGDLFDFDQTLASTWVGLWAPLSRRGRGAG